MSKQEVKINLYNVISSAMDNAARHGVNKAFKYIDKELTDSEKQSIIDSVYNSVMFELGEVIEFE